MNTLEPFLIPLAMIIVPVVLLLLMQLLSVAQNAGNTLVLGVPGFVPLKNGKAGSQDHKPEDGAS
jgi:hypothetical protein